MGLHIDCVIVFEWKGLDVGGLIDNWLPWIDDFKRGIGIRPRGGRDESALNDHGFYRSDTAKAADGRPDHCAFEFSVFPIERDFESASCL